MRTEDLQLGDCVVVHDHGHSYLSGKEWKRDIVMAVTSIDMSHVGCVGLDDHGVMQYGTYFASQIEPLPLTIEFLQKNFPEYEEGYEIGWWYEGEWGDESKGFMIEFRNDNIEIVMHSVRYVHEVQHIVKVCGLQKEIRYE